MNQLKNNYTAYARAVVNAVKEYISGSTSETYIVQKGDSLYSIARKFNTTINELKSLNNLTSNTLSIGQQLKIPKIESEKEYEYYVVRSGDTLYSIANKYNLTVDELKRLNNLTGNTLSIGQQLIVRTKEEESPTLEGTYIVQKGDTHFMGNNE